MANKTIALRLWLTVNSSLSFKDYLEKGRYDYIAPELTEGDFTFESSSYHSIDCVFVHLDRMETTPHILDILEEYNLRPGSLQELLALGYEQPGLQRAFPISALGTAWKTNNINHIVYLSSGGSKRSIDIHPFQGSWGEAWRFLGICKS